MSDRVVYWRDRWIPEKEARVPLFDAAVIAGEAAFEVTRTFRHQPFRLEAHLDRLQGSLEVLKIELPFSLSKLREVTEETLAKNLPTEDSSVDWQIIHNISRGPVSDYRLCFPSETFQTTLIIACFPLVPRLAKMAKFYQEGVDLCLVEQPAIPTEMLPTHIKTRGRLHYQLAAIEAEQKFPGQWPILLHPEGHLTEGTSYNLFWFSNGELYTAPERDVLVGITRGVVIETARRLGMTVREEAHLPEALANAEEAFVTATTFGLLHARSVQGKPLETGSEIGPKTRQLRTALHEVFGIDFEQQAIDYREMLLDWQSRQTPSFL
ncbi:Hypothetical protein PBC10988_34020 [Planctomycetales bacterium 10988]|nr:Hypothetical protein PBC10988_34020 [Planctomycetales bacterium 10988]